MSGLVSGWLVVLCATALTLVPSAIFVVLSFRGWLRRAPLTHLVAVFAFSLLAIPPARFLEDVAFALLSPLPATGLGWFALDNLSIGVIEESVKLAFFLMLLRGPPRPAPVAHAVLYAVAVSLGFAAMENVDYGWEAYRDGGLGGFTVARGLIPTPSHMQDGVLMGFLAGQALVAADRRRRALLWTLSLLLPALSHAAYDFSATLAAEYDVVPPLLSTLAMFAAFSQVIGGFFLATFLIRRSLPRAAGARRWGWGVTAVKVRAPAPCPVCDTAHAVEAGVCEHRGIGVTAAVEEPAA